MGTGVLIPSIIYSLILLRICRLSEELRKQTKILKHKIQERSSDLTLQDDSNYICSLIDEFKGFDAKGYFIVNNSLLTSYTIHFLTFLVIVIGFNQDHFFKNT